MSGIESILKTIESNFGISDDAEITLEMDPGTFDSNRLKRLKSIGINRVSMGVQSFNDETLVKCGRSHCVNDVNNAINDLKSAGIDNYNIDLISSLPNVSIGQWEETLRTAVSTGCTHISIYDLQIEEKTAFGRWFSPGN